MNENKLKGIEKLSIGQLAALRREAGKRLSEADASALQAFYTAMPYGTPDYSQERMYAVMCIMCLWKPEERKTPMPFAKCLGNIRQTDSADGRLCALLDTDYQDDDGFLIGKLARLAKQIHASEKRLYPDFEMLYDDLLYWNSSYRGVQRKWMAQYVGENSDDNLKEENGGNN